VLPLELGRDIPRRLADGLDQMRQDNAQAFCAKSSI
jgi:hypothetical protein